jgi:hypothetical protein
MLAVTSVWTGTDKHRPKTMSGSLKIALHIYSDRKHCHQFLGKENTVVQELGKTSLFRIIFLSCSYFVYEN